MTSEYLSDELYTTGKFTITYYGDTMCTIDGVLQQSEVVLALTWSESPFDVTSMYFFKIINFFFSLIYVLYALIIVITILFQVLLN